MKPSFISIARRELGETDLRKSQSLQQFRDWIAKHPLLEDARQGEESGSTIIIKVEKVFLKKVQMEQSVSENISEVLKPKPDNFINAEETT